MAVPMDTYKLEIELISELLGSIPKDPDVWSEHVRSQYVKKGEGTTPPTDEFLEPLAEAAEPIERGWTGFHIDHQGRPVMFNYQLKGFLKESGNVIKETIKFKNLRSHIADDVFVFPRQQVLADKVDGVLERPLRAMTMQGPRVTVVRSDYINPGRTYVWEIKVLKGSRVTEDVLRSVLDYGELRGLLQWRSGGYGCFTYTLTQ